MTKIHHNTLKKAKAHGLEIVEDANEFFVFKAGVYAQAKASGATATALATARDPKDALDLAIRELTAQSPKKAKAPKPTRSKSAKPKRKKRQDDDGEEDDEEEGADLRSVVKSKYREKYRPHKGTCGDDLAKKLRDRFMTLRDPDTKKPRLDFAAFMAFAKANDVWVEGYKRLKNRDGSRNDGLIRMNCANRLRAAVRKGHKIVWGS